MAEKNDVLRRYTNLAAAIHLLRKRKITLLDPATWDDKVDVDYMRQVGRWVGRRVLALCFCQSRAEKYQHWRVYASGMDGVCIVFHKEHLTHNLSVRYEGLLQDNVTYGNLAAASERMGRPVDLFGLPFLKRAAYKDECEYRIVRLFNEEEGPASMRDYDIDLGSIERIVLSPWMPKELGASVRTVLMSIDGCEKLNVTRSALIDNERWKKFGDDVYRQEKKMMESAQEMMTPDNIR